MREADNQPEISSQSAELFRLIVENVKDYAIFMTDEAGSVVNWNPGVERLLGYAENEIVGQPIDITFTSEDAAAGAPAREMEQAARTGCAEDKRWHRRSDGSLFWANGMMMPLKNADGGGLHGFVKVMRDDTAQKLNEEKLEETNRRVENILSSVSDAFYTFDREFRYTLVNEAAAKMIGLPESEILGKTLPELFPDVDGNWFHAKARRALDEQTTVVFENFYAPLDRWFENRVYPFPDGVSVFTTEITARKRAERAKIDEKFLFEIAEKIRRTDDAEDLLYVIACAVGEQLRVRRCLFNEIDLENDRETVHRDYCRAVESVAGANRISDYSSITLVDMKVGKTVVNRDSKIDARTAKVYEQTYAPVGERAYIAVPLLRENRWVASLWASDDEPRDWRDAEINLLETVAERAWMAVEKLRSEAALRESAAEFRRLANVVPQIVWVAGADGKIEYVNEQWTQFSGLSLEETDQPEILSQIIHPDDRKTVFAEWSKAFAAGKPYELEARMRKRATGEYCWFLMRSEPSRDASGAIVKWFGTSTDVTFNKETEMRLRESEERFSKAFKASPLVLTISSLTTGELVEVNETFVSATGFTREEAVGKTTLELGLWKKPTERETEMETVRQAGQLSNAEYIFNTKSGAEIIGLLAAERIEIGGEPFALTVIQDITERARAEQALQDSEEKFRDLANSISQFAWMADASGHIFWYNERWFDYTGTTFEEMQNRGWQAVYHPDYVEPVVEKFKRHIASGEVWEDTFPLRSRTGEYRWFLSRASPIRDEQGQIMRWFGTNTDIEEVRQARLQAEAANRLKDEFLATVSHELRTPLNAVLGWSEMLKSGKAVGEIAERAVETIYRNAKSQAQLIEDLLDVSRIITGKMQFEPRPVRLSSVIEAAVNTLRPAADAKSIEIEICLECENCLVGGDEQRLQQIVWNLISNAVKFTPEGGGIEVELQEENSHARLTVKDTGKGIEAEFLPFIFERFRQEDPSSTRRHGGLGLGLAIVRHLVELHGGTIAVGSAGENQGSTFTLQLPLVFAGERKTNQPIEPSKNLRESLSDGFLGENDAPKQLTGVCVLLVDDEPDTLSMLEAALTLEGADARAASSAADAFEIFLDWHPDVIVSDIAMPDEDGYSLIKKVRELKPEKGGNVPAIAMTAYVRVEDRMRVLTSGFQMYVPKPAEPAELITAIINLAGEKVRNI